MINKIDIQNFGSFHNFDWSTSVRNSDGNVAAFKKLNILYGRNYSGKTTLSRILRALETGSLPEKYESPSFSATTDFRTITHANIPVEDHHIRVYNKDFVEEHLGFLRDDNDHITPFAIIGSDNKLIEKKISIMENELGDAELKTGLRHEHATKHSEFSRKKRKETQQKRSLSTKLTNKATQPPTGIKHNSIYKDPNYNTPKIEADIRAIKKQSIDVLGEKERKAKEALLVEVPLPDIEVRVSFTATLKSLHKTSKELLSKKIIPTQPIQELLDDAILQAWVKEGIPQHKEKRNNCGFCGQPIPKELWKKLDEHFSKESSDLEYDIQQQIKIIEKERETISKILTVEKKDFYSTIHISFDKAKLELELEISKYIETLNSITERLRAREVDIFTIKSMPAFVDNSENIAAKIVAVNELISKNNKKSDSLDVDQNKARRELRLNEIAAFIKDIDLAGEEKKIADLKKEADILYDEVETLYTDIKEKERLIDDLRLKLKDERKGAEKVNEYLNHFFGHEGLRLEAEEDNKTLSFKFKILRGDKLAYNLSEGECSLVAFCYFMAKLEDAETKGKKLVIYIDDPISSLDSNHIFFVFSLIESLIAKAEEDADGIKILGDDEKPIYHYEQLFISTHNLEFLKYLKKLTKPKKNSEQFLVLMKECGSTIELMPAYLKNYITEFNYLFGEIYTCSDSANASTEFQCFYNFGNNLRKFLEAFLYFKYPFSANEQQDYNQRVKKFFKNEPGTETLVQRLTNEFSHLGGGFDRSVQPIDHAEISRLAIFVLKKIKEHDSEQFNGLLESIDRPDPFVGQVEQIEHTELVEEH